MKNRTLGINEILQPKRREILEIAARHGAGQVRVFGSVARGEAREDSDIDLLVSPGPVTSAWFPAGLMLDLQELLGREVDVVSEKGLHWYIRDRILSEAVPL
jgi:predicted nucleotidyltransferase